MGLSPHFCFLGVGVFFFFYFVLLGWWWFYFDFLVDYFFKGIFFIYFFVLFCVGSVFIFV